MTFQVFSSLPRAHPSSGSPLLAVGRVTGPSRPGRQSRRQGKQNREGEGKGGGESPRGRRGWRGPLDPWPPCSVPSVPDTLGLPHGAGRRSWVEEVQDGRGWVEEALRGRVCKAGSLWGCQPEGGRWWGGRREGACHCDRRRELGRKGELRSAGRSPAIRSGKICFLPPARFIPTKCPISQNGPYYCLLYYFRPSMFIRLIRIFSPSFHSQLNSHLSDILKSAGNWGGRRGSRSPLGFSIPCILGKISQGGRKGGLRGAGAASWCLSQAGRGGGSLCQIWGGGGLSWGGGEKFGEAEGEGARVGRRQWQWQSGGGGRRREGS